MRRPGWDDESVAVAGKAVYRPVLGRVLVVSYAVFAAWWLLAGLESDSGPGVSWTVPSWLVVAGAVVYALLWRPAVVVGLDGVRLLNVLRDVTVPWEALEGIRTRYALTLITAEGTYTSWAAGAPGRANALARAGGRRAGPGSGEIADTVEAGHLPRRGWLPGGVDTERSSRDLRSDSGAAAFLVEQAWVRWRDRPRLADDRRPPAPPVEVRWNVPLLAAAPVLLALAVLSTLLGS